MSLYLCVFASADSDDEVDGVDVGSYQDFHEFRHFVARHLGHGDSASRFPTLLDHPDSDTEWTPRQCVTLREELATILAELGNLPAAPYPVGSWQAAVATEFDLAPRSRAEWFLDIDGEPLVARIDHLAALAVELGRPLTFM
jgi:hypothetical protein